MWHCGFYCTAAMTSVRSKLAVAGVILALAFGYLAYAGMQQGWVYFVGVEQYLSDPQFAIQHVTTAAAACDAVQQGGVDVVILDLGLPDATDLEALNRLETAVAEIPVIVLTGRGDESLAVEQVMFEEDVLPGERKRAAQEKALTSYGWSDKERRLVNIPIEDAMQLAELKAMACDDGQGFLLGRPLDECAAEALLHGNREVAGIVAGEAAAC